MNERWSQTETAQTYNAYNFIVLYVLNWWGGPVSPFQTNPIGDTHKSVWNGRSIPNCPMQSGNNEIKRPQLLTLHIVQLNWTDVRSNLLP